MIKPYLYNIFISFCKLKSFGCVPLRICSVKVGEIYFKFNRFLMYFESFKFSSCCKSAIVLPVFIC